MEDKGETLYKWVKASKDNLPPYEEEVCIRLDGENLYIGCLFDERHAGDPEAANAFFITGLSFMYFESGWNRIEWLKPVQSLSVVNISDEEIEGLLLKIVNWELPSTGQFWDKEETQPMSYEAAYGSNGARDYIRNTAKLALVAIRDKLQSLKEV